MHDTPKRFKLKLVNGPFLKLTAIKQRSQYERKKESDRVSDLAGQIQQLLPELFKSAVEVLNK